METKYFMYSIEQLKLRKELDAKIGKTFKLGYVFVNGSKKPFTELCSSPDNSRFSDSKVVVSGDISTMKYKMPQST